MHVLFITSWFETPSRPTAGKAVKDLAIALSQQGISVSILFSSPEQLPWHFKSGDVDIFHIRSTTIVKFYPLLNIWALKNWVTYFDQYVINKGKPDLIHIHSYSSLVSGYEINRKYRIPFLYTEHSSQIAQQKIGFIKKLIIKYYLHACNTAIAVSEYLKNGMLSLTTDVKTIPNTIDFNFFVPNDSRKNNQLIMVNLLTENKQVHKGIEAYKYWKLNNVKAEMYIIGDGPDKASLQRLAENEDIHFIGEQKESVWIKKLQSSACLLLMSKSESFGVVVLEALACHVPVICFDNGGVREITKWIPDSNMLKILNSSATSHSIAEAINETIVNYSTKEAIRVRETLMKEFSYKLIASKYINVYTEILNKA